MNTLGLICLVLSVGGVLLNNNKLRAGFLLWLISNALSGFLHGLAACQLSGDLARDMWTLAARDGIFFVLAIHGFWAWRRRE
jgi:hypothetical protein